jgi:hypothetical protein
MGKERWLCGSGTPWSKIKKRPIEPSGIRIHVRIFGNPEIKHLLGPGKRQCSIGGAFHEMSYGGTALCARSIEPFERSRPWFCGGRGPYGNSIEGRCGVEVRGSFAAEHCSRR